MRVSSLPVQAVVAAAAVVVAAVPSGVQAQVAGAMWPTFAYNALHTGLSPFSGPVGPKVQGKWQVLLIPLGPWCLNCSAAT